MISKVLKLSQLSRLLFLSLINQSNEFMICKSYPINFTKRNKIYERQLNVAMNYDKFKDLSDRLNIIPLFHASIVVNNWINYVQDSELIIQDENGNILNKLPDTNNQDNQNNINNYNPNKPDYLVKSLYDMKVFISINNINNNINNNKNNKNNKNTNIMMLAWIPNNHLIEKSIAYLVATKIENNNINIYRFAQNPYFHDDFTIRSINLKHDIEKLIEYFDNVNEINFDELHKYDPRYNLSWHAPKIL